MAFYCKCHDMAAMCESTEATIKWQLWCTCNRRPSSGQRWQTNWQHRNPQNAQVEHGLPIPTATCLSFEVECNICPLTFVCVFVRAPFPRCPSKHSTANFLASWPGSTFFAQTQTEWAHFVYFFCCSILRQSIKGTIASWRCMNTRVHIQRLDSILVQI